MQICYGWYRIHDIGELMDKKQLLSYLILGTLAFVFLGSGLYLGLVLMDHGIGDCMLFCFFIAFLLYISLKIDKNI